MPQKNTRMDDVTRPEKVTPPATARPILVSDHATLPADPMMAPADDEAKAGEQVPMTHTAKTIRPVEKPAEEQPKEAPSAAPPEPVPEKAAVAAEVPAEPVSEPTDEAKPDQPEHPIAKVPSDPGGKPTDDDRDSDAAVTAEEAAAAEAKQKREQELDALIESGKYAVPINAVQRRRSRTHSILLALLALLLALALFDAIADVGIVKLPSSVPHTHFFSGR